MNMSKTVMVVDDDPDVTISIKQGLENLDEEIKVLCVESGKQCLEFLGNNQIPDVILLDIMMPEMSGWELFDRLKENNEWRDIPVMFLTGRTDRIAENAGRFLGDDYIEKPFEIEDLKTRIGKILKKKGR
ncbi:unnamed protein product [marine sediment metagenome]|uniref:Response regulatory domain-containing protein n=1 Tax=marine sediment metagenome TaxID=412755 RepID=X0X0L8_9ZZZZ